MVIAEAQLLVGSLNTAMTIARGLVALRDEARIAAAVAELNDKLLDAQQGLFALNGQLLALQQEHIEATQKLREMREAVAERGRYTPVEISPGQWAYRKNIAPQDGGSSFPGGSQSPYCVCQQCLDVLGKPIILQRVGSPGGPRLFCPGCKTSLILALPG